MAALIVAAAAWAQMQQPKPYKVVFDLTNLRSARPDRRVALAPRSARAQFAVGDKVVIYGRGHALVVPGRSAMTDDVKQAIAGPHVSFKVCEIAMRNQNVDKSQLLPNVSTVPDGIGEIVARQ